MVKKEANEKPTTTTNQMKNEFRKTGGNKKGRERRDQRKLGRGHNITLYTFATLQNGISSTLNLNLLKNKYSYI